MSEATAVERGPMELAVIEWYGGEFSETDSELLQIARGQDERMLRLERERDGLAATLDACACALHAHYCGCNEAESEGCVIEDVEEYGAAVAALAGVPDER